MSLINSEYKCKICNKEYKTYQTWWKHNKKFHTSRKPTINSQNIILNNEKPYGCRYCSKGYDIIQSRWKHEQKCKIIKEEENKKKELELSIKRQEIAKIRLENNIINKLEKEMIELKNIINKNISYPINNNLIEMIVDKNKTIEELKSNVDTKLFDKTKSQFILNDISISCRNQDNYIDGLQLCQAYNKDFNVWSNLPTTSDQLNEIARYNCLATSELLDEDTWIHPDVAIVMAYWISPTVGYQVDKWINKLFAIDIQLLEDKNKELELKDQKIKLLENVHLKNQKRNNYPGQNFIYLITSKSNKEKRIYIVGKAVNLRNRLSNYNKSEEHEVIYYKECADESSMSLAETLVLKKLNNYRERANRDRFILPIDKEIDFFIKVFDDSIKFMEN